MRVPPARVVRAMRATFLALLVVSCGAAPAAAPAPASTLPPPDPRADLHAVATGARSLASLTSPQVGVVVVTIAETGDAGRAPSAERLCGDALAERLRELEEHLRTMARDGIFPTCSGATCTDRPSMEWDPARHYRFEPTPDGPRIAAIHLLDEAVVLEAYVAEERRRAVAADRALEAADCGASLVP